MDPGATRTVRAQAHSRLAMHLYAVEALVDADREAQLARDLLAGQPPSPGGVWAAAVQARVAASRRDGPTVTRLVAEALPQAEQLGLVSAEVDLMMSAAFLQAEREGLAGVSEALKRAHRRALAADDPASTLRAGYLLSGIHVDTGDLDRAVVTLREVIADAVRSGLGWSLYALECRGMLVNSLEMSGCWDQALSEVALAADYLPESQHVRMAVPALPVRVARDPADGITVADRFVPTAREHAWYAHQVFGARSDGLVWLGRPAEAVATVQDGLAVQAADDPFHLGGIYLDAIGLAALAALAEAARLHGDAGAEAAAREAGSRFTTHARDTVEKGTPRYTTLGPEGKAWLARVEAEACRLARGAGAVDAWRAAAEAFCFGHPYEVARSRWRLAEALVAAGDRAGAAAEAVAARRTVDRLGARPLRDALDALARRARLDLGAGPVEPGVLTPREQEVLGLVAHGLTNRQIGRRLTISEKTASVHVSNILTKLDAASRAEAVTVAHRRGLLDPAAGG